MIHNKLRQARDEASLTALRLGELAGVHEMRVYALERGRIPPRQREAQRIAAALDTTPAELFPGVFSATKKGGTQ